MAELARPAAPELAPPRWQLRWTAAETIVAGAVALVIVIFAIFGFLVWQAYWQMLDQTRVRAQTAAGIVANETQWLVGGTLANLQQIANVATAPSDVTAETKAAFDQAIAHLPGVTGLGLYDATGNAWADAGSPTLPEDISGSAAFEELEAGGAWTITPQFKDISGKDVFVVAQRLQGPDGFGGVALATIDAGITQQLWAPQNLGDNSTLSLAREDGIVVSRYPAADGVVDLKAISPAWPQVASSNAGDYTAVSGLDGVVRTVGFRHIPDLKMVVLGSIARDTVLGALWSSAWTVTWLLLPIALALLGGAIATARILRRSAQTQARLSAAVDHNEVLFREIHHRVKNNLQSVGSLLQMQPIPREIKADMGQRIAAMSAVHEHIYRSSNFSTVSAGEYLATLIGNIRAGARPDVQVAEDIDDIAIDKDAATPLGLIVNEVVSNAFKHAFPGERAGTIKVHLIRRGDGRGELTVADDGVGYDPAAPAKGIGRRLIGALTQQLGGESEVRSGPAGSVFTLVFPLGK